jgi:hypothetical protein
VVSRNGFKAISWTKGGKIMPRYTIDSPEVQNLVRSVFRCSPQSYFRIDEEGKCRTVALRRHLMELGINQKSATELMQQADIPYAEFVRNKVEKPAATGNEIPKKTRRQTVRIPLEEDDEDTVDDSIPKNCRYHLIQQGDYFGAFDGLDGGLVLFRTQAEAKEYIHNLLHHREGFKIFYGGKSNNNNNS